MNLITIRIQKTSFPGNKTTMETESNMYCKHCEKGYPVSSRVNQSAICELLTIKVQQRCRYQNANNKKNCILNSIEARQFCLRVRFWIQRALIHEIIHEMSMWFLFVSQFPAEHWYHRRIKYSARERECISSGFKGSSDVLKVCGIAWAVYWWMQHEKLTKIRNAGKVYAIF